MRGEGNVEDVRRTRGARRARLTSRRQQRNQRYGRFLRWTVIGTLVPGTGLIAAGKRRLGTLFLVLLGLALLATAAIFVLVPQGKLASYAGDRQMMLIVGAVLAFAAVGWLLVAVGTHRVLEPDGLPAGKRLGGALAVVVVASLIVAPMAVGSRYAFTQRELIGAISSDGGVSHTTPKLDVKDPWANKPRLNLLFLGGDGGAGREGIRPDTQIVASIDTETGATTMISLPRNLQNFPFPAASPLSQIYPNGFSGPGDAGEWMLNAVYRNVPAAHPEVFEGISDAQRAADANKWAVGGALGIDIDYYMMVNLDGFQAIVDALGGITLDVPRDIPYGNKNREDGKGCTKANGYIYKGDNQHLDGFHALWFARSRCGSDDYDRMERQRCVMNAIVAKADPATLLTQYQRLATATKDIVLTDIPADLFPDLIELTLKVKKSTLESLTLDNKFFRSMGTTSADPDYPALHARVAEILTDASAGVTAETPAPGETPVPGETTSGDTSQAAGQPARGGTSESAGAPERVQPASGQAPEDAAEPDPDQPVDAGAVC